MVGRDLDSRAAWFRDIAWGQGNRAQAREANAGELDPGSESAGGLDARIENGPSAFHPLDGNAERFRVEDHSLRELTGTPVQLQLFWGDLRHDGIVNWRTENWERGKKTGKQETENGEWETNGGTIEQGTGNEK